jgi:transcriptional regulator with XRE-family HTH domain
MNGHKLMKLRMLKGLSQIELAELMGTSATIVNKIESGKSKNPTIKTMLMYCNKLDISVFDFLGTKHSKTIFLKMIKEWVDQKVITEKNAEDIYRFMYL